MHGNHVLAIYFMMCILWRLLSPIHPSTRACRELVVGVAQHGLYVSEVTLLCAVSQCVHAVQITKGTGGLYHLRAMLLLQH